MPKPEEYIAILYWGKDMASFPGYIREQQARAAAVNAPLDAIFEDYEAAAPTGRWSTVSELAPDHRFRRLFERAMRIEGRCEICSRVECAINHTQELEENHG